MGENKHCDTSCLAATLKLPLASLKMRAVKGRGKEAAGAIITENGLLHLVVDRIDAPFLDNVEGVVE
jgi:hypothetical protein